MHRQRIPISFSLTIRSNLGFFRLSSTVSSQQRTIPTIPRSQRWPAFLPTIYQLDSSLYEHNIEPSFSRFIKTLNARLVSRRKIGMVGTGTRPPRVRQVEEIPNGTWSTRRDTLSCYSFICFLRNEAVRRQFLPQRRPTPKTPYILPTQNVTMLGLP